MESEIQEDSTSGAQTDDVDTFRHGPLARQHIRLMRIISTTLEVVHCETRDFPFGHDTAQIYMALSYVWGDPEPSRVITLNGKVFRVRQNLFDYLCYAHCNRRGATPGGWMWIDQISIDQSNIVERNRHVSIMSEIYRRADDVTIWLGNSDAEEAMLAMGFLNYEEQLATLPANKRDSVFEQGRNADISIHEHPLYKHASVVELELETYGGTLIHNRPLHKRDWHMTAKVQQAMATLLQNVYWTRLWVVQEVLLSHKKTIQWHQYTTRWESLEQFLHEPSALQTMKANHSCRTLAHFLESYQDWAQIITTVLQKFCHQDCADPRDKVYGLLPIAKDSCHIAVDYTLNTETVFTVTALRILEVASGSRGYVTLDGWATALSKLRRAMLPLRPFDADAFLREVQSGHGLLWQEEYLTSREPEEAGRSMIRRLFNL